MHTYTARYAAREVPKKHLKKMQLMLGIGGGRMKLRRHDVFKYAERDVKTGETPVLVFVANLRDGGMLRVTTVMNPTLAIPGLMDKVAPERETASLAIQNLVRAIDREVCGGKQS